MKKIILYYPVMLILLSFIACDKPTSKSKQSEEKDMSKLAYFQFTANGENVSHETAFDDISYGSGSVNGGENIVTNTVSVFKGNKQERRLHTDIYKIADDLRKMKAPELEGKTYPLDFTSDKGYSSGNDVTFTITKVESREVSDKLGTSYRIEGTLEGSVKTESGGAADMENGKAAFKLYQKDRDF
ncbi:MAG: hypothetical protein ACLFM1_05780 [Bacteroidales bacterium]